MKKIFFIITFFSLSQINFSLAQTEEFEQKAPEFLLSKKEFNPEKILKLLFEGKYDSEYATIAWKPYPKENVPVSYNGLCYTNVDTTLYYKNDTLKYALAVLRSIEHHEGGENSCAGCPPTEGLALFVEENDNWKLVKFNRSVTTLGQGGFVPQKKIIQIGKNEYALALNGEELAGGGPIGPEYEYWFRLNESYFSELVFMYYKADVGDDLTSIIERRSEFVRSEENEFYDIILKTVLVDYEHEKPKILKIFPDEKHEYKYGFNGYVLKKQ